MKCVFALLVIMAAPFSPIVAQTGTAKATQNSATVQEIIDLEKRWGDAIQRRDSAQMEQFLADSYFLAVGVRGTPLEIISRKEWLENLKIYRVESYSIDDIKVHIYGDTAVVLMLWTQKAKVGVEGADRSAQFVLTDIWVKQKNGWRVAERHSSRPEQP